jgi:hypothetical protein
MLIGLITELHQMLILKDVYGEPGHVEYLFIQKRSGSVR